MLNEQVVQPALNSFRRNVLDSNTPQYNAPPVLSEEDLKIRRMILGY